MLIRKCLVFAAMGMVLTLISAPSALAAAGTEECLYLLGETGPDLSITTTRMISARDGLPEYCHVQGLIPPNVGFEVKLPTDWNGKFFMVGNGGFAGLIQDDQTYGLRRGYATAATDTGHEGPEPSFALSRAAEIDFGYRSVQVTQLAAKRLIDSYYGRTPRYSYFSGCSTGGRQALLQAQRYPDSFDGIIAGAPIYDFSQKQAYNAGWVSSALFGNNREGLVPLSKLQMLSEAVYANCDTEDGLEDGIIDDPRECSFDPLTHLKQCPEGTDSDDCFTPAQIEAIVKIYEGPGDLYTREGNYPGHVVGAEWMEPERSGPFTGGWDLYFIGLTEASREDAASGGLDSYGGDRFQPVQLRNSSNFFRYFASYPDMPDFDATVDLDFSSLPPRFASEDTVDATDPDLSAFRNRGGKIVMWHGWADVGLIPMRTIEYYEKVQSTMGATETDDFLRLFMLPGMYHCSGGPGPDTFDDLTALERWVEQDIQPDRITAYNLPASTEANYVAERKGLDELDQALMSRPICPYPEVARYDGTGSTDDAANFMCVFPSE